MVNVLVVLYALITTLAVVILFSWLLRYFAHNSVTWDVLIVVWISWVLSTVIISILPLDISGNLVDTSVLYPFYAFVYWTCFILTWFIAPVLQGYKISGSFTTRGKLIDSLRMNIIFVVISIVLMIIGFIYLLVTTGLSRSDVLALVQALGNLWGLSLAILTVGYGLIEIPRFFWYRSNYEKRIQYQMWNLAQLFNEKDEANDRIEEYLYLFQRFDEKCEQDSKYRFRNQREIVKETLRAHDLLDKRVSNPDITQDQFLQQINSGELSEKLLAKIHTELKIWIFEMERSEIWWVKTVHDILVLEMSLKHKKGAKYQPLANSTHKSNHHDKFNIFPKIKNKHEHHIILNEEESRNSISNDNSGNYNSNENEKISGKRKKKEEDEDDSNFDLFLNSSEIQPTDDEIQKFNFIHRVYWYSYTHILPIAQKIFAIALGMLSLMIIWSEMVLAIDVDYSIFAIVVNDTNSSAGILIFSAIAFAYASACSLFSVWRLHFGKLYHMHAHQLTDDSSLLSNATFCTRLMFPLGYNFILLSNTTEDSSYFRLFSNMQQVPILGDPINTFLPLLIFLFCLATWFNIYGRLLKCLRISRFEFGDPHKSQEVADQITTGELLLQKFKRTLKSNDELRRQFEGQSSQWASPSIKRTTNTHDIKRLVLNRIRERSTVKEKNKSFVVKDLFQIRGNNDRRSLELEKIGNNQTEFQNVALE